jgi:hypothetical protein
MAIFVVAFLVVASPLRFQSEIERSPYVVVVWARKAGPRRDRPERHGKSAPGFHLNEDVDVARSRYAGRTHNRAGTSMTGTTWPGRHPA